MLAKGEHIEGVPAELEALLAKDSDPDSAPLLVGLNATLNDKL